MGLEPLLPIIANFATDKMPESLPPQVHTCMHTYVCTYVATYYVHGMNVNY